MDIQEDRHKYTVFFDGVCNFCNSSINFIIDRDPKQKFQFASLQSVIAEEQLPIYGFDPGDLHSIILLMDGKAYQKSTAALKIARQLSGPWPLLYAFIIVPAFIRDAVYSFIAKNRYKWFGKMETCRIPTPDMRERFLDSTYSV